MNDMNDLRFVRKYSKITEYFLHKVTKTRNRMIKEFVDSSKKIMKDSCCTR